MPISNLKFLPTFKELEYIQKLPFTITKHNTAYNLRCPICGDSHKTLSKKRGWILTDKTPFIYHCFNCGTSITFKNFLRITSPMLYDEYLKDLKKIFFRPKNTIKEEVSSVKEANIDIKFSKLSLDIFENIKDSQIHLDYCKQRQLPQNIVNRLMYIKDPSKVTSFLNSQFLIFPFYYKNTDYIYGFQGRNILEKKFYTFLLPNFPKIYNLYNVDYSKTVYIFESIIDSLFIPNSIAMLGSDLPESFLKDHLKENLVFIFDNDPTGLQKSKKYLEKNFKVLLYPKNIKFKDINEMVLSDFKMFEYFKDNLDKFVSKGKIGLTKLKLNSLKNKNYNGNDFINNIVKEI